MILLSGCDELAVVRAVGSRTCLREVHSRPRPQCYCGCGDMWHTNIHYNINFNPCDRCLFVYLSHVWFNLWIDFDVCSKKLCHTYLRYRFAYKYVCYVYFSETRVKLAKIFNLENSNKYKSSASTVSLEKLSSCNFKIFVFGTNKKLLEVYHIRSKKIIRCYYLVGILSNFHLYSLIILQEKMF